MGFLAISYLAIRSPSPPQTPPPGEGLRLIYWSVFLDTHWMDIRSIWEIMRELGLTIRLLFLRLHSGITSMVSCSTRPCRKIPKFSDKKLCLRPPSISTRDQKLRPSLSQILPFQSLYCTQIQLEALKEGTPLPMCHRNGMQDWQGEVITGKNVACLTPCYFYSLLTCRLKTAV